MTAYRCTVDGLLGSCVIQRALPCWHAQCDETTFLSLWLVWFVMRGKQALLSESVSEESMGVLRIESTTNTR